MESIDSITPEEMMSFWYGAKGYPDEEVRAVELLIRWLDPHPKISIFGIGIPIPEREKILAMVEIDFYRISENQLYVLLFMLGMVQECTPALKERLEMYVATQAPGEDLIKLVLSLTACVKE